MMRTPYRISVHVSAYDPAQSPDEVIVSLSVRRTIWNLLWSLIEDRSGTTVWLLSCLVGCLSFGLFALVIALAYLALQAYVLLGTGTVAPDLRLLGVLVSMALLGMIATYALVQLYWTLQPTHLGLDEQGLRFMWLHQGESTVSCRLEWQSLTSAGLRRFMGKDVVELVVAQPVLDEKYFFVRKQGLTRAGADASAESSSVRIPLVALETGSVRIPLVALNAEGREALHGQLKRVLSFEQYQMRLREELNPLSITSYTSLWLDGLTRSLRRQISGSLQPGELVANGKYRIERALGRGGQGQVYLSRLVHGTDERLVVLKQFILPTEVSASSSNKALSGIEHESRLLTSLDSPQIVKCLDVFVDDHRAYLVLEYVEGTTLRDLVAQHGPLPEEQAISLGLQMCRILQTLHEATPPVVHRDFTPDNLIADRDGKLKLIDFNISQLDDFTHNPVAGKFAYMPPEQMRGDACPASDIYALGCTLHYLVTGEHPEAFTTARPRKLISHISAALDEIVASCTAQEVEARPQSAGALLRALAGCLDARPEADVNEVAIQVRQ